MSNENRMVASDDYGQIKKGQSYKVIKEGIDYITVSVGGAPVTCYMWLFRDDDGNPYKKFEERREEESDYDELL